MSTVKELRIEAKSLKIVGYSRMRKDELETAITEAKAKANKPANFNAFTDTAVQEIGRGSLANAAIYIDALTAANGGRKGPGRLFRKRLRAAGFPTHASVDVRKINEYRAGSRKAA